MSHWDRWLKSFVKKKCKGILTISKDDYSEEEYNASLQRINENIEEIKQHLLDDNMVVSKGTDKLTVKIFPNQRNLLNYQT